MIELGTTHISHRDTDEIYDKELGAIVTAFELWRAELQSSRFPIQGYAFTLTFSRPIHTTHSTLYQGN